MPKILLVLDSNETLHWYFLDFDENKLRFLGFFLLNVSAGEVVFLDVLGPND